MKDLKSKPLQKTNKALKSLELVPVKSNKIINLVHKKKVKIY
jgi:hypothetical protein